MNDAKPKTVFDERDQLKAENERLREENALLHDTARTTLIGFENKTLECVGLRNQLDAARKVADAAVAWHMVMNAANRARFRKGLDHTARNRLLRAWDECQFALKEAVAEYRKLKEGE